MKKSVIFVLFAAILFTIFLSINFVSAENLNLKINGTIGNLTSDFRIKTNSQASLGVEGFDLKATQILLPDTYAQFYSTSTGTNLIIDSWNGTLPRVVNMTYHLSTGQTGNLNFSWIQLSGNYSGNFSFYGADSTFTTAIDYVDMTNTSLYSTTLSGATDVYAQLAFGSFQYTSPVVSLLSPSDGTSSTTSAYNFTFTVSSDININSCSLYIDNSNVASSSEISKTATNGIYYSGLSTGAHTWKLTCLDSAGNTGTSNTRSLTVTSGTTTTTTTGGGGGGGGATINKTLVSQISELQIIPNSISMPVTAKISTKGKVSLKNLGNSELVLDLSVVNLEDIVTLIENSIILQPGETRVMEFSILSDKPGILTGKIKFSSGDRYTELPVSLNVKSELSLFDISLDLSSKAVDVGKKISGQITLIQAGLQEKADVSVEYVIKDFDGNTYYKKAETLMVDKQKSYQYIFPTDDLPPGDYLIGAEVIYSGGVATASSQIKITGQGAAPWYLFVIIVAIAGVLVFIAISYTRKVKLLRKKKKK